MDSSPGNIGTLISTLHTVIKTKLHPPISRSRLIDRHQLTQRFLNNNKTKLTLVAAPAGFGKTTLIGQLFEQMSAEISCCWYSLDQSDNDPTKFLLYFIASIRTVHSAFGESTLRLMESTLISDITEVLALLVNDLLDANKEISLFIDDYHFSDSDQTNQFIELLINLSPDNFRLIISSRLRPNISLSGLKVHGYLNEITANQLRFDDLEAKTFMNDIHKLDLSSRQLIDLYEHSEGWVAGLQLASLSLRDISRRDDFIDSFSGNLRDIAEYLAADVLNQQSQEVRNFLLRTSILERINAEVGSVLTGIGSCQIILDNLEEQNLFIIPLDKERQWYRYHHLFHEFLLGQLRKRFPAELVKLYNDAADWFEHAGLASEAVDYALLSGDMDKAVELVESQVEEEMKAGRMPRVNNWVDKIPDSVCLSHPKLLFAKSTSLYHMNKPDEADLTLSLLRQCDVIDKQSLEEYVMRLEAGIAICRDDVDGILPPLSSVGIMSSNFDNGTACNTQGYALASLSEYALATESLNDARHYHKLNGSSFGVVYADCFLGFIDLAKGNLNKCYDRFADYVNGSRNAIETYVAPVPSIMRGIVLYEWNKIDEAAALIRPSLPVIEKVGHIKLLSLGYLTLAKVYAVRNDHLSAMRYFDRSYSINERRGKPYLRLRSLIESERIRYLLENNRTNEAMDIATSMDIDVDLATPELPDKWDRITCLNLLIWTRLQIASGAAKRSIPVLVHLTSLAEKVGRFKKVIECKLLTAMAMERTGDIQSASSLVTEAVNLSAPNGLIRTFLDEEIPGLLVSLKGESKISQSPEISRYLNKIISANEEKKSIESMDKRSEGISLIEPLNEREIDILKLIASGQSNHIIGEKLSISENTVKWHVKNLFVKLNVNKRTAAVVVAQQLELLN